MIVLWQRLLGCDARDFLSQKEIRRLELLLGGDFDTWVLSGGSDVGRWRISGIQMTSVQNNSYATATFSRLLHLVWLKCQNYSLKCLFIDMCFNCFWKIPTVGITEPYGRCTFSFLRNCSFLKWWQCVSSNCFKFSPTVWYFHFFSFINLSVSIVASCLWL